jgi:hypothetical protein
VLTIILIIHVFILTSTTGRLETIDLDSEYIFHRASITNISMPWNNKHKLQVPGQTRRHVSPDGVSKTAIYMKELDREQIEALYDVYRMDFEMFGYALDEYFD